MLHDDMYIYFKRGPLSSLNWICGDEDPHHMTCNGQLSASSSSSSFRTPVLAAMLLSAGHNMGSLRTHVSAAP